MPIYFDDVVKEAVAKRKEKGITIFGMAWILGEGMTAVEWQAIEQGNKKPDYATVSKLRHWIGQISDEELDAILKEESRMNPHFSIEERLDRIEAKIDGLANLILGPGKGDMWKGITSKSEP